MFVIPIPIHYSPYIKKEDARDVFKNQRKIFTICLITLTIVIGILQFLVVPKLLSLYQTLDTPVPIITQSSTFISGLFAVISLIAAIYMLFSKPDYTKIDTIANKYKNGEMIKVRELKDHKYEWILLAFWLAIVGYQVVSIVLPIYSLSNQF